MLQSGSKLSKDVISEMHKKYTANATWGRHASRSLEAVLDRKPGQTAIIPHDRGFFQSSKKHWPVQKLLKSFGEVDWSQSWSLNLLDGDDSDDLYDPRKLC